MRSGALTANLQDVGTVVGIHNTTLFVNSGLNSANYGLKKDVMYKILIVDDKALEDLKVAILEDAQNREHGQSMSDLNAVVGEWIKLQPEVTRWSVRGNGKRTLI